jgi:membrane protein YqaA with SNARE-associated domain
MKPNAENLPVILALATELGFFALIGLLCFREVPQSSHAVVMAMTGTLSTAFGGIIGFYFGSSAGSAKKTSIMAGQTNGGNGANNANSGSTAGSAQKEQTGSTEGKETTS